MAVIRWVCSLHWGLPACSLFLNCQHSSLQPHFTLSSNPPPRNTHTHIVKQRQTGWQRGVVPMMKHLKQAVEACVHPLCLNPLTAPVPAWTPHQQVSMTWGGGGEEAQFNNAKATSVSQMESLFPRGWGGVGLKHQAPAGPHDCADIAA